MNIRLVLLYLLILNLTLEGFSFAQSQDIPSEISNVSVSALHHRAVGDSLRMAGDLSGAVEAYRSAYSLTSKEFLGDGEEGIAYSLASTLALKANETDEAFAFLMESLPTMTTMKVLYDPDLYFLIRDERWKKVEDTMLDQLEAKVMGNFDRDLARRLLDMRRNEWVGRYHIMLLFRQSGGQSPVLSLLSDAMGDRHRANEADLKRMLDNEGWPKKSAVGAAAAYAASNVLTHMGLEARQNYLPMMAAACKAGEADWPDYAPSLDRTELESGRLQVYGTQMQMDEETGEYIVYNLLDPDTVEDRRAAIGLEPLSVQLERFNAAMKRDFESH